MKKGNQADLLKDNHWKLMRKMSLPGILGMLVISLNSLIDSIYLGNLLGADAFAGVSLLFPLTLVITSVTVFVAAGSSSVLSRAIGAKKPELQSKVIPNLIALSLLLSLLLMLPGILFTDELVALTGCTGAIFSAGAEYFSVYIWGIFFSIYGLSANGLIRSEGKIKQAMTYTLISVALNLALTPLFISTFSMGIAGAAWSSIASMIVYSLLTSWYFISGKASFATGKFKVKIEKEIIGSVLNVGLSAFAMQFSNVLRQFVVFRSVAWYGSAHDIVFFSAAFRLFSLISIPAMGLLQPLQPIVGVNFGASNFSRCIEAVKTFRTGGILLLLVFIIPLLIFPENFIRIMIPGEVLSIKDLHNLRLILLVLPALPVASGSIIFFQATGKGKQAGILPVARQLLLFLPLIWLMPRIAGIDGIYYGLAVENIAYAAFVWVYFRYELKKPGLENAVKAGY